MTDIAYDDLDRVIRGAYRNVPAWTQGLCRVCSAPTSGSTYDMCVPCTVQSRSGVPLARGGVVPLSWAPMDSQGYQDLRQYKESDANPDQIARLRTLFALAFTRHSTCIVTPDASRPVAVTHVPSTSGLRPGPHPLETHIIAMLAATVQRVTPAYVGPVGGERNDRRVLDPAHWQIDLPPEPIGRVLVVDDSWVSGGHAQSVASAFEMRGVAARIIVLGRALNPSRTDHGGYLRQHPGAPFDSTICPVHRLAH